MSGFGAVIAGAVGKQIVTKLGEHAASEVTLQWRYRQDVLDLENKMKDLDAVLGDADAKLHGEGQEGRKVYERWLTKFKRVVYDVEDVLDELDDNELIKKSRPKVNLWFSRHNQLLQRITMPHKMKNVMKKVDKIKQEGSRVLKLVPHEARGQVSRNNEIFAANWNGHGVNTGMVGRGIEKEKIISLLLTSEEANQDISIIPVVGLGGVGKTTLVESVLADKRVIVFHDPVWVNVSKQFDLHQIGSAILKSLNRSINLNNCTMQFLYDNLNKELANRRYLIVLDDLWEDGGILESLKRMLQHGLKGSRIVVTTRSRSVVRQLHTVFLANQRKICPVPESKTIELGVLEPGECWELMKQRAFGPDDDHSGLEEIGKQIAGKCGGLPLVANALGQVMSELRTMEAWKDIRDTMVDLGLRAVPQQETLERLMLSYYHMKPEFKKCFTYLAAFPKGFVMDNNHIIQQWNALGCINSRHNGQKCINYLLDISFLRIPGSASTSGMDDKGAVFVTMHDLAYDLASVVMCDDLMVLHGRQTYRHTEYCRYAVLRDTNFESKAVKLSSMLPAHLRALHWLDRSKMELSDDTFSFARSLRVLQLNLTFLKRLPNSICQLRRLRYLSFSGCSGLAKLPDSFGALITLVDINLSGCCGLVTLPESFGDLTNVSSVSLSGCYGLAKLPESFGKVKKLVYLDLSFCCCFEGISGILAGLTNLEHLNLSNPYNYLAQRWSRLKGLKGTLCKLMKLTYLNLSMFLDPIFYYESEKDNREFIESITTHLLNLRHLDLSHNTFLFDLPEDIVRLNNLHTLKLSGCFRLKREQWMFEMECIRFEQYHFVVRLDNGVADSSNLVELEDVDCEDLEISCLENVKSMQEAQRIRLVEKQKLQKLALCWTSGTQGCLDENALLAELVPPHSLQCLVVRGYGSKTCLPAWRISSISSHLSYLTDVTMEDFPRCVVLPPLGLFPNLRRLILRRMARITRIDAGELSGSFTQLSKFTIDDMQSLEELTFPVIDELVIQKCPMLNFGPVPPRAQRLLISDCDQAISSSGKLGGIDVVEGPSTPVTQLVIQSCNAPLGDWSLLHHLPGLCSLTINNCCNLTSSPEITRPLSSLQSLCFSQCHEPMESLPVFLCDLTSLQKLAIDECHGIQSLPEDMLAKLTGLKALYIWDCPELKKWCESEENKQKLAHIRIKFEKLDTSKTGVHFPEI